MYHFFCVNRMSLKKFNCRSLQELFLIILLVATVSVIVTYQISRLLPRTQRTELKIHLDGHVDIYRNFEVENKQENVLEGFTLDKAGKRHAASYSSRSLKNLSPLQRKLVQVSSLPVLNPSDAEVIFGQFTTMQKVMKIILSKSCGYS